MEAATRTSLVPAARVDRASLLALAPRPGQEVFSGRARDTLPEAERSASRHPYAMVEQDRPVGFLVLDDAPPDADPTADLLLRGFFVDAAHQGRGVAGRALDELPATARLLRPSARSLVLTVNVRNVAARAAYLRHGFVDDGTLYLGGAAGPQHLLRCMMGR